MDKDGSMSNSAVGVGDRLIKWAMIVGMIATVFLILVNAIEQVKDVGDIFNVACVVSFVLFVLLWSKSRTVSIVGIVGVLVSIIIHFRQSPIQPLSLMRQESLGDYNPGNLLVTLYLARDLLLSICVFSLSRFVQGWKRRFIIGVAGFSALIACGWYFYSLMNLGGFAWIDSKAWWAFDNYENKSLDHAALLVEILKFASFFLVLRACMRGGLTKPQGDNKLSPAESISVCEEKKEISCACAEQAGKRTCACLDFGLRTGFVALMLNMIVLWIAQTSTSLENSMAAERMLILVYALAMIMLMFMCRVSVCSSIAGGIGFVLVAAQVGGLFDGGVSPFIFAFQLICLAIGMGGLTRYLLLGKKRKVALIVLIASVVAAVAQLIEGVGVLSLVAKGRMVDIFFWVNFVVTVVYLVEIVFLCMVSKQITKVVESRRRIDIPAHEEIKVSRLMFALCLIAGFVFLKVSRLGGSNMVTVIISIALILAAAHFLVGFFVSIVDRCIRGRMGRLAYFLTSLCVILAVLVVLPSPSSLFESGFEDMEYMTEKVRNGLLGFLLNEFVVALLLFYFWVKRLHDIGWTSKLAIWMLVLTACPLVCYFDPAVGAALTILTFVMAFPVGIVKILLLFVPGAKGANKSGEGKDMSLQSRLTCLKDLHDKGLMTDFEYEKKRKDILDSI